MDRFSGFMAVSFNKTNPLDPTFGFFVFSSSFFPLSFSALAFPTGMNFRFQPALGSF